MIRSQFEINKAIKMNSTILKNTSEMKSTKRTFTVLKFEGPRNLIKGFNIQRISKSQKKISRIEQTTLPCHLWNQIYKLKNEFEIKERQIKFKKELHKQFAVVSDEECPNGIIRDNYRTDKNIYIVEPNPPFLNDEDDFDDDIDDRRDLMFSLRFQDGYFMTTYENEIKYKIVKINNLKIKVRYNAMTHEELNSQLNY